MRKDEIKTLTPPFEVICINDSNRPKEIPPHLWVVKGRRYTVIKVQQQLDKNVGFVLEELPLGEHTEPFDAFATHRFGIPMDMISAEADQAVEELKKELETQPV